MIIRPLRAGDLAMTWGGDMDESVDGAVEYVAFGIHAQVWPGQRSDVAYVPELVSERPGSGQLDAFLTELVKAVAPREVVFVNVINWGLSAHLDALGFRQLIPEDAFEDDGEDGLYVRSLETKVAVMSLPLFTWCEVCGNPDAILTTKRNWLNGLPVGVYTCQDCRDAVKRRDVGVSFRHNGHLRVNDGREKAIPYA